MGRSRGGLGSQFHRVTDRDGTLLAVEVSAGQIHESTRVEGVMKVLPSRTDWAGLANVPGNSRRTKGDRLQGIRDWLTAHGIKPVIPHKEIERARHDGRTRFDKKPYRQRANVEQCVGWMKERRTIGTRFKKLAVNFHGMLQLAMIGRYLRILFSDRAQ